MSSPYPSHPPSVQEEPPRGPAVALRYHERTKHTYESVRRDARALDWANQPSPYKRYLGLPKHVLPRRIEVDLPPTLNLVRHPLNQGTPSGEGPLSLPQLSALCYLGYGITAQKAYPGGTLELRAAPSAGALFPCELYICLSGIQGIGDGVYHYEPAAHSLICLREGDCLPYLRVATGNAPALEAARMVFVVSAIWWRSAWKYRDRAYRYCLHDTGHLAGNLLLASEALDRPATLVYDFVDDQVNLLLGLDPAREAALVLLACGHHERPSALPVSLPQLESIVTKQEPLSACEETYPSILEVHGATSLSAVGQQIGRPGPGQDMDGPDATAAWIDLPEACGAPAPQTLVETIAQRRSTRRFARQSISSEALALMLQCIAGAYAHDQAPSGLLDAAVIINAVDGVPAGLYRWDPAGRRLWPLREGDLRAGAQFLGMEQPLCGDAAASIFLLANLPNRVAEGGERAYRRVHIEAGLRGELIYLASRALGLGCSGIGAFYDDQAAEFLGAPQGAAVVYDLVVGVEAPVG